MEFEVFATNVDLQDIPSYTTNITLEGQLLKISFVWNERIGKRTIFIRNSADICYLQNTILHPNESFELNSNAVFDDLPYKVVLQKVGDTNKVGNIYKWSKDFILCFYRTVDIETERLNVKYGVNTPSTPTLPKPFGNWILNQGYELVNEDIKYTAYNTNGVSYYDSYANFNLVTALVRSFHDLDLQQYVAFKTAVQQLSGAVDWVLDPANNQIVYTKPNDPDRAPSPTDTTGYSGFDFCTGQSKLFASEQSANNYRCNHADCNTRPPQTATIISSTSIQCTAGFSLPRADVVANPNYDPEAESDDEESIPLETVAQQVISNAESSADEVLKLLSQDYINLVANSVFDSNPSKQFVKLQDLIPQLEANKVLR
jgi:hypothetical protein